MIGLGYAVGDTIRIFETSSWGPGSYSTGTVSKVTPKGEVTVTQKRGDAVVNRRFTATGREYGRAGRWTGPFLVQKSEQDERAACIREANAAARRKQDVRTKLDAMVRLDPNTETAELIQQLRSLANELETAA